MRDKRNNNHHLSRIPLRSIRTTILIQTFSAMFKLIRITILLLIFVAVAFYSKNQKLKSRNWAQPLEVMIYPMNGDNNSPIVDKYMQQLEEKDFAEIDSFFQRESKKYQLATSQPTLTHLGRVLSEHPPTEPARGAGIWEIAGWGLKLRYWAFNHSPDPKANANKVLVFLYYHQDDKNRVLQHSLGMDKGLLTIVHAFASKSQAAQNNVVIAHEILHTVGATDKYDPQGEPVFPAGYAEPDKQPLYPQKYAEIMSGHIPKSATESQMAEDLSKCVIGTQTAREINWARH